MNESNKSSTSSQSYWPLYKIVEPHETNDVLLPTNNSKIGEWLISDNANPRFVFALQQRVDDFSSRAQLERPLITLQLLKEWRNQIPPGRFLVTSKNTPEHLPLYEDVGEKKARAFISKVLKHMMKRNSNNNEDNDKNNIICERKEEGKETAPKAAMVSFDGRNKEEEGITSEQHTIIGDDERSGPAGPPDIYDHAQALGVEAKDDDVVATGGPAYEYASSGELEYEEEQEKGTVWKQVDSHPSQCHAQQSLIGREKEMEQLYSLYETVRNRHVQLRQQQQQQNHGPHSSSSTHQQKQSNNRVDLVLLSGTEGVGKSSLLLSLRDYLPPGEEETPLVLHAKRRPPSKLEWCSPKNEMMANMIKCFCRQVLTGSKRHLLDVYRHQILQDMEDDDLDEITALVPAFGSVLRGGEDSSSYNDDETTTNTSTHNTTYSQTTSTTQQQEDLLRVATTTATTTSNKEKQEQQNVSFFATRRPLIVMGRLLQAIASASSQPVIVFTQDMYSNNGMWQGYAMFLHNMAKHVRTAAVLFAGSFGTGTGGDTDEILQMEAFCKRVTHPGKSQHNICVHHIPIENLPEEDSARLVERTLYCGRRSRTITTDDPGSLNRLSSLIFSKAKGHPQFTMNLLQYFRRKGLLKVNTCNENDSRLEFDVETMNSAARNINFNTDLIHTIVRESHPDVQEILRIAAYLCAPQIDTDVLGILAGRHDNDVRDLLEEASDTGLIGQNELGLTSFASVGVRNAVYELVEENEREDLHLQIARKLLDHENLNEEIRGKDPQFQATILKQFMMSDSLVTKDEDRRSIACLCLRVGQAATKQVGFVTAWTCISHALTILESQKKWGAKNYDLTLQCYNLAIEICYCNTIYDKLPELIEEVLQHARTFDDSLIARSTQIYALGSQNKTTEAIQIALETLEELGEKFPHNDPSPIRLMLEFRKARKALNGKSDEDILCLRRMKDSKRFSALMIMNHVLLYLVLAKPKLAALVAFRMVKLTLEHGICALSSVSFAIYGVVIASSDSLLDEGFRYARLALKLYDKFKTEVYLCRISAAFYGSLYGKKYPIGDCVEPLRHAHRVGFRTGDIEFAVFNGCLLCWNIAELRTLPYMDNYLRELASETENLGQMLSLSLLKAYWQSIQNLMGMAVGDPKELKGELVDEELKYALSGGNSFFLLWWRFYNMQLSYLLGDYDRAESYSDKVHLLYDTPTGAVDIAYCLFYECLVHLAQARRGKRRRRHMRYVRNRVKMLCRWAVHNPTNFLGKQMLLEAELFALEGRHSKALAYYRSSILHLKEGGFLLPLAIGNELLGRYLLNAGDRDGAGNSLQKAYRVYKDLGGTVIVQHFETEMGALLSQFRT